MRNVALYVIYRWKRKVTIYKCFLMSLFSDLRAINYLEFTPLIKVPKL